MSEEGEYMKVINRTGHDVVMCHPDGQPAHVYPPAGEPIRLETIVDYDDGGTVVDVRYGTANLPPEEEGTVYIVSLAVALSELERDDLVVPHDPITENGRVVGCRRLARPV